MSLEFEALKQKANLIETLRRYWRLTDKKGDGEVPFLIVISRDLGLDDQFWVKFKATKEGKGPI